MKQLEKMPLYFNLPKLIFLSIWITLVISCSSKNIEPDQEISYSKINEVEISSSGEYEVHLSSADTLFYGETIILDLKIDNSDSEHQPVSELSFSNIEFIMSAMGHGGDAVPFIIEVGDGAYKIEEVKPIMAGDWNLKVIFNSGKDTVSFDLWAFEPL